MTILISKLQLNIWYKLLILIANYDSECELRLFNLNLWKLDFSLWNNLDVWQVQQCLDRNACISVLVGVFKKKSLFGVQKKRILNWTKNW